jgi:hypothetical protein
VARATKWSKLEMCTATPPKRLEGTKDSDVRDLSSIAPRIRNDGRCHSIRIQYEGLAQWKAEH